MSWLLVLAFALAVLAFIAAGAAVCAALYACAQLAEHLRAPELAPPVGGPRHRKEYAR